MSPSDPSAADQLYELFQREASLLATVRHPALPRIWATGEVNGRPYIVQELLRGKPLSDAIAGGEVGLDLVLRLATTLAGALEHVHRNGLVHRDIKPQNILLGDDARIWLIDFGVAIPTQTHVGDESYGGTVAYSAPEQTGLLAQPVDGRADLYSLGVVLFECCTGSLPFKKAASNGQSPQPIGVSAPDVRQLNPEVGETLAAAIARLLRKDPADRFQSGAELAAVLSPGGPPPERTEASRSIELVEALIGRKPELTLLFEQWDLARIDQGHSVLVVGRGGMGKSRLVGEFLSELRHHGALVLRSKCSEADPTPFSSLTRAINDHLNDVQELPEEARDRSTSILTRVVRDIGPILGRLSPSLSELIADDSPAPELRNDDTRYFRILAEFLSLLATGHSSAVWFIDDVQWLDESTWSVLERLAEATAELPFMLVGAARPQGDDRVHIDRFMNLFGAERSQRIKLSPLDSDSVAELASNRLGGHLDSRVAARISSLSGGNPLMVLELVRSVVHAGVVLPAWGDWEVQAEQLDQLNLPGTVVELISKRLEALDQSSLGVLREAAVHGFEFRQSHLSRVHDDEAEVSQSVRRGLSDSLVEQVCPERFGFVHDRIREALVRGLTPEQLRQTHQRWALVLESLDQAEGDQTYSIARHFGLGLTERSPKKTVSANLAAGHQAAVSYAAQEAFHFFETALAVAGRNDVEISGESLAAVAEACIRTDRWDEAGGFLAQSIALASTDNERAMRFARLSAVDLGAADTDGARRNLVRAFSLLGAPVPTVSIAAAARVAWDWFVAKLISSTKIGFGTGTQAERSRNSVLAHLLDLGGQLTFFELGSSFELVANVIRGLRPALRLGPSEELVGAYCNYAAVLSLLGLRRAVDVQLNRAHRVALEIHDRGCLARVEYYRAVCVHFLGDSLEAERLQAAVLQEQEHWLDPFDYVNAGSDLTWNWYMRGHSRSALDLAERIVDRCQSVGRLAGTQAYNLADTSPVLSAVGRPREAIQNLNRAFELCSEDVGDRWILAAVLSRAVVTHVIQGETGPNVDKFIERFRELAILPSHSMLYVRDFYVGQARLRLKQLETAETEEEAAAIEEQVRHALAELKTVSNSAVLKSHYLTCKALHGFLTGRTRGLRKLMRKAEGIAAGCDNRWARIELLRLSALIHRSHEELQPASFEANLAFSMALEQGWEPYARSLRREFGLSGTTNLSAMSGRSSFANQSPSAARVARQLEALTAISLSLASTVDADEQTRVAVDEIVRILGAERALLFRIGSHPAEPLEFRLGRNAAAAEILEPSRYSRTVVERVRTLGEGLVLNSVDEGASVSSESIVAQNLRSIIAAPMLVRNELVGVIYLENRLVRGVFVENDINILSAVGTQIAIAQKTAGLIGMELEYATERQKRIFAETISGLATTLSSSLELVDVLDQLLKAVTTLVECRHGSICLAQEPGKAGELLQRSLPVDGDVEAKPVDSNLVREVVETCRPLRIDDLDMDARFRPCRPESRSLIAVPITWQEVVIAVITLEDDQTGSYSAEDTGLAVMLAGQAASAVAHACHFQHLQSLAATDSLTGVSNRRQFLESAQSALERAASSETPLSLLLLDLDHFKNINDTYGHSVGDQVLKEFASRCQGFLRGGDVLGRLGGEEFGVLLPRATLNAAESKVAQRLREGTSNRPFDTKEGRIQVTVSIGVAHRAPGSDDLHSLMESADKALYVAKSRGRDCVVTTEDLA